MRKSPVQVAKSKARLSTHDSHKSLKSNLKLSKSFVILKKAKKTKSCSLPSALDILQSPDRKRRKNQLENLQSTLSPEYIGYGDVSGKRSRYGRAQKHKENDDFLPTQVACYVRRTPPKAGYVTPSNESGQKMTLYESPIEKLIKKNKMLVTGSSHESATNQSSEKSFQSSENTSESIFNELGINSINNNEPEKKNEGFLNYEGEHDYNTTGSENFTSYLKSPSSHSTDSAKGSSIDLEIDFPVKSGDVFWARISPFPYWPCMVWPDPNGRTIVLNNNKVQRQNVKIHVRFFGDNGRRGWVNKSNMLPYNGRPEFDKRSEEYRKKFGKKHFAIRGFEVSSKRKFLWENAVAEADEVNDHPLEDRQNIFEKILEKNREMLANERIRRRQSVGKDQMQSVGDNQLQLLQEANMKRGRSPELDNKHAKINEIAQVKRMKFEISSNVTLHEAGINEKEIEAENNQIYASKEFERFYEVIKNYVFQNENHFLEGYLEQNVRKIWYLRQIAQASDDDKRVSVNIRKLSLQIKEIGSTTITPFKHRVSASSDTLDETRTEKKNSKSIEEVVDDIMDLGRYYLFRGLTKESVCKRCYRPNNLIKCSGTCQSLIHKDCDNISKSTHITGDLEDSKGGAQNSIGKLEALCSECSAGECPKCFVCKKNRNDLGDLIECHVSWCPHRYHLHCLKYWPQSKITKSSAKVESLFCPAHVCHTCVSDDPRGKFFQIEKSKLVRCVECPATYHLDSFCIPAGAKFLTATQIICPRHGKHEKINVNASWCFICATGGSLICCDTCPTAFHLECLKINKPDGTYICEECETGRLPLYGELVWAKLGNYRWWPSIIIPPPEVPKNLQLKKHDWSEFCIRFFGTNDHTWINRNRVFLYQEGDWGRVNNTKGINQSYKQGLEEAKRISEILKKKRQIKNNTRKDKGLAPLPYTKIKFNRPVAPVKLQEVDISELTQCECNVNDEDPCGQYSGCLNRLLMTECNAKICPAGSKCQNQLFEKRLYPPLKVYWTNGRGWGLLCEKDIKSGTFIIEYVGEVIDDKEFQRRIAQKQEEKDENYYFLTLEKDYIIDAGPKGNLARFMNHSCEPNCETQKWTVNGITRIGLFAVKDIPAKTELTFNYNLECLGSSKKICHCGSEKCAGFIGSKYKENEKVLTRLPLPKSKQKPKRNRKQVTGSKK